MNFDNWEKSKEKSAINYRWYTTANKILTGKDIKKIARDIFNAGKNEKVREITNILLRDK